MAQEFPQFDLVEELEAAEAAAQVAVGAGAQLAVGAQPAAGAGAQPPVGASAQAAGGAARNAMRWTNAMSIFMLRRM